MTPGAPKGILIATPLALGLWAALVWAVAGKADFLGKLM